MNEEHKFKVAGFKVNINVNGNNVAFKAFSDVTFKQMVQTAKDLNGKYKPVTKSWQFATSKDIEEFVDTVKQFTEY